MDVAALEAALVNLPYWGTAITFNSLVVDLSSTTVVNFDSLFRLPVSLPLPMAGFGTLSLALRAFLSIELQIPEAELDVMIWLQEEINING